MRVSMLLSVALNLYFLATMVAARVDPSHLVNVNDREPILVASVEQSTGHDEGAARLQALLQGAGLEPGMIKSVLLGWLLVEKSDLPGVAGELQFWQQGFTPSQAALREKIATEQSVRDALISLYGQAAADDAAFDFVFRPLDPALSFLSSAEQLWLEQYQLEQLATPGVSEPVAGRSIVCAKFPAARPRAGAQNFPAGLVTRLGAESFEEYLLRFSPLSERLRVADVARDEAAFRRIFALLRELERQSSPASQIEIRARLREEMGDAGFARFWSAQDPAFQPLAEYLRRQGFTEQQVQLAYAIVNQTQEALLELMSHQPDQQTMLSAAGRLKQQEMLRLTQLLGEAAAAGLAAENTRFAMSLAAETTSCTNGFKEEDQ